MTLLERSVELLKHSRTEVIADPSLTNVLTEIFRFRGENVCSACPGVLSGKYDELNRIVRSGNFNNIIMAKAKKLEGKARRYMLPEGKAYRPFGLGVIYTNDNLTDEIAEKLIEANPSVRKVFIDLNEEGGEPEKPEAPEVDQLKAKYKELFGSEAPVNITEEELREVINELSEKE